MSEDVAALERDLALARESLRRREQQLDRVRSAVYQRDFELASTRKALAMEGELSEGWRAEVQGREGELIDAEAKLVEAELRAERSEEALASIRGGRAYKLMRLLWRLRRPFKRK